MEEVLSGEIQTLKNMIESSNSAVNELRQDITRQTELGKSLQGRMDSMNANMRAVKHEVNTHQQEITDLHDKLVEMEDRSRRCNVRLVGLPESAEGENAVQFLQEHLPELDPSHPRLMESKKPAAHVSTAVVKRHIVHEHSSFGSSDIKNRERILIEPEHPV
ncbi:hypothetical protein QQF64_023836 [Cirrhinus molitorella]|uniref:Uncharacterized protein n=1 Tax=Cirrhinus molitorella TaxID=172907 RepID=A0ABR3NKD9_9TELE